MRHVDCTAKAVVNINAGSRSIVALKNMVKKSDVRAVNSVL